MTGQISMGLLKSMTLANNLKQSARPDVFVPRRQLAWIVAGLVVTATANAAPASGPAELAADGRIVRVGPTRAISRISDAALQARDGDTIEIDEGDYFADTAVWKQERLTIRGAGKGARLVAAGAHAEGKAIWVVRGGQITIENMTFTGARVPDHNGAGIRFEKGHLIVRNCVFKDNENGLMTAGGEAQLEIEGSEFANNGIGDGRTHNLYVGAIRKLTVKGSYFHHANVGHLLKSRAAENHIINNRLTDELGGRASYELEFPNGGVSYVIGNIIEQSSTTENSAMIAVGGEGYTWPRNELYLVNNTIADDRPTNGIFLSIKPGLGTLKAFNNILIGNADSATGTTVRLGTNQNPAWREIGSSISNGARDVVKAIDGTTRPADASAPMEAMVANNVNAEWGQFAAAVRYDYRIRSGARPASKYQAAGSANGISLTPIGQYHHPRRVDSFGRPPSLPGALQEMAK